MNELNDYSICNIHKKINVSLIFHVAVVFELTRASFPKWIAKVFHIVAKLIHREEALCLAIFPRAGALHVNVYREINF